MVARESLDPDSSMWHWLAVDLHFWRTKKGESCSALGKVMGLTRGAVSNLEAARPGFRLSEGQAEALDAHWELNGHFGRLLRYAKAGHDPDWFKQHVQYEVRASVMRLFESLLVPGLLQTEAYVRAWLRAGQNVEDVEAAVSTRLERQEILSRPKAPLLWVLLDEAALDRPMGGPEVMQGQLARLLEVSEMPNVTVRVIPWTAGGHLGLEGPFVITTVEEGEVAYMEACGGGRLTTDRTEVRKYGVRYDRIGALALPVDLSRDLIARKLEGVK